MFLIQLYKERGRNIHFVGSMPQVKVQVTLCIHKSYSHLSRPWKYKKILPSRAQHRTRYLMEKAMFFSVIQASMVNGATIDLIVMGGVMWGSTYWYVSRYSMYAT
jgi:hypothetical protein